MHFKISAADGTSFELIQKDEVDLFDYLQANFDHNWCSGSCRTYITVDRFEELSEKLLSLDNLENSEKIWASNEDHLIMKMKMNSRGNVKLVISLRSELSFSNKVIFELDIDNCRDFEFSNVQSSVD